MRVNACVLFCFLHSFDVPTRFLLEAGSFPPECAVSITPRCHSFVGAPTGEEHGLQGNIDLLAASPWRSLAGGHSLEERSCKGGTRGVHAVPLMEFMRCDSPLAPAGALRPRDPHACLAINPLAVVGGNRFRTLGGNRACVRACVRASFPMTDNPAVRSWFSRGDQREVELVAGAARQGLFAVAREYTF